MSAVRYVFLMKIILKYTVNLLPLKYIPLMTAVSELSEIKENAFTRLPFTPLFKRSKRAYKLRPLFLFVFVYHKKVKANFFITFFYF